MIDIISVSNFKNYIKSPMPYKPNKIVIHGTAGGTYSGALQTFINGERGLSTHFIISQDAKIYRLFPEQNYAYHAGSKFRIISESSFGIQIVNWVNLTMKNGKHYTWTGKQIDPKYVITTESWRGCRYWHAITDQQHQSLQRLLKYLCQKYGIRKKFFRTNNGENINTPEFSGIIMHSTFHPTRLDFEPSIIPRISI